MSEIDFARSSAARFLSIRRWRGGAEWHPVPHKHNWWELVILIAGAQRAILPDQTVIAEAGDILIYPPGVLHDEHTYKAQVIEFYCVWIDWPRTRAHVPYCIRDRQGRVQELARWLNAEDLPVYAGSDEYMRLLTQMLVAELMRLVATPSQEVVDDVRRFVRDNMAEHLTLDDLAAHCGLNKFHFVRKFRSLTGLSPMEYVRQVRLDNAMHLVTESDLPLHEVAPRVGFANEYHLSRLLKKRYGVGVRELRKRKTGASELSQY